MARGRYPFAGETIRLGERRRKQQVRLKDHKVGVLVLVLLVLGLVLASIHLNQALQSRPSHSHRQP
jgi:hypothetical protein